MKRTLHKALSMLLTAAMELNMGLTECHTEQPKKTDSIPKSSVIGTACVS